MDPSGLLYGTGMAIWSTLKPNHGMEAQEVLALPIGIRNPTNGHRVSMKYRFLPACFGKSLEGLLSKGNHLLLSRQQPRLSHLPLLQQRLPPLPSQHCLP